MKHMNSIVVLVMLLAGSVMAQTTQPSDADVNKMDEATARAMVKQLYRVIGSLKGDVAKLKAENASLLAQLEYVKQLAANPKPVAETPAAPMPSNEWPGVKKGMTRNRVLELLGDPKTTRMDDEGRSDQFVKRVDGGSNDGVSYLETTSIADVEYTGDVVTRVSVTTEKAARRLPGNGRVMSAQEARARQEAAHSQR